MDANPTPNPLEVFFIALVKAIITIVMEKLRRKKPLQLEAPKVAQKRKRKRRHEQLELPLD